MNFESVSSTRDWIWSALRWKLSPHDHRARNLGFFRCVIHDVPPVGLQLPLCRPVHVRARRPLLTELEPNGENTDVNDDNQWQPLYIRTFV